MKKGEIITYEFEGNLYVNTTNRCDFACSFCLRQNGDGVGTADTLWLEREPTCDEILADIDRRDLSRYNQLVFCGYGEPTYRFDDICRVIDRLHAEGKHPFIRMDTNGTGCLINGRDICPECKGRFDKLSISLNAPTKEQFDALCHPRFPDAYEAMKEFTRRVTQYVPEVMMTVVDRDLTPEEIEECGRICRSLGASYRVRAYIAD